MIDQTSFSSAAKNMQYDVSLFQKLQQNGERFFRIYEWEGVGITQSEKRAIPEDLLVFDHSYRLTGGGVVFHSPGDVVFSIGGALSDSFFPAKSKDLLSWCSDLFGQSLSKIGIAVTNKTDLDLVKNINFCASYFNPYELYVGNAKIFGFALKKTRTHFLIQGVIHVKSTFLSYESVQDQYNAFFSTGIPVVFDHDLFSKTFESLLRI